METSVTLHIFVKSVLIYKLIISIISVELAPSNKCKVPEGLHKIIQCADHFNFVNCPTYDNSDECKLTKEFVESQDTCGFKAGEVFIIDHRFFEEDEVAGNETEVTSTTVVE